MYETRATVLALTVILAAAVATVAPLGAAAENIHDGGVDPATVEEETTPDHSVTFDVDGLSKDGSTDTFYVEFPDAATLSPNGVTVTNRSDGSAVSISSSIEVVDGPDGDGVQDTLRFAVSPDGEGDVDVTVTVSTSVTWPAVDGTTTYPLTAKVVDSDGTTAGMTQFASVTVTDTDGGTDTPTETATPTETTTPTETDTPTQTATPTATPVPPGDVIHSGSISPDSAPADHRTEHAVTYVVEDVTRDGNTDRFFVEFPDGAYVFPVSASAETVAGQSVAVSSSVEVVDGPDGDGVAETLTFAVSPDGEGTVDLRVTVRTDVTWPEGGPTTVTAAAYRSGKPDVTSVDVASVSLTESTSTATREPTDTATPIPTETVTAGDVHDGEVSPNVVREGVTVDHRVSFVVDSLSRDGSTDRFYVQFPNSVDLSPNGVTVSSVGGGSVSVASSIEVVDGPDGDGVKDTLTFAVSPDGSGTVDVNVTVDTSVTWPETVESERLPIRVAYSDSARGDVGLTQVTEVGVLDENASVTATQTADQVTGSPDSTPTDAPAFPTAGVLLAVVGLVVLRLRRR